MIRNYLKVTVICIVTSLMTGCGKEFLDAKPIKNQQVPASLEDFLAMMDHTSLNSFPAYISMIGAEDFWVTDAGWNNFPLGAQHYQKNVYIWADNVFEGASSHDWDVAHGRILACNIVLDGLGKYADQQQQPLYRQIKGTTLFHRARFLYNLAQLFAAPYKPGEDNIYGLPFYLTSAITESTYRRSVPQTYAQILTDLSEALELLPEHAEIIQQPDKTSALAMLSRVYLQMGDFEEAFDHADQCLARTGNLLDYNTLNLAAAYPFPIQGAGNPEILFYELASGGNLMARTRMNVTDELLEMYGTGDLRRQAFILDDASGRKIYKGSYMGSYSFFIGMATDEVYLIRAESAAHLNKLEVAIADINRLRKHRYTPAAFMEYDFVNAQELLQFIADERRRELPFRNRRWEDLRRWNTFMDDKESIRRRTAGGDYELPVDDPKWTWPLPDLVIQYGKYGQNPR